MAQLDGIEVYGTSRVARRDAVESGGARWVGDPTDIAGKVDAVFDPVGGPSLRTSRRAVRPGGVVVSYGFSFTVGSGHSKFGGLVRTAAALVRSKLTPGPPVRLYRVEVSVQREPAAYRQDLTRLVELLAEGRIRPAVSTMALTEAAEAHRRLEGRRVIGKLVLIPAGAT